MAETSPATLTVTQHPSPTEQQQVIALIGRAAAVDGHASVNEAGLLALRSPGGGPADATASRHVLAHDRGTGELIGYAQAVTEESGRVAALVVDPGHRRQGLGSTLWRQLAAEPSSAPLRVWAKGDAPAARALAAALGLRPVRTLLILGRPLSGDLPPADPPVGIAIRTFRPGLDEESWLAVNARAFAFHPEQGSLTRTDLDQRMAEPWFDPAGFFVAVRDEPADGTPGGGSSIVGFHW
ncbi:MAG TPA: mycothiol synthase, partial [Microlunatus sp.]|nr:mycothiol synthase [Microlunatus sp.]